MKNILTYFTIFVGIAARCFAITVELEGSPEGGAGVADAPIYTLNGTARASLLVGGSGGVECEQNLTFTMDKPTYCTMKTTTKICALPRCKWPTLKELHFHLFQETPSNLHNSMIDVWACLRCYLKIMTQKDLLEEIKKLRLLMRPT